MNRRQFRRRCAIAGATATIDHPPPSRLPRSIPRRRTGREPRRPALLHVPGPLEHGATTAPSRRLARSHVAYGGPGRRGGGHANY